MPPAEAAEPATSTNAADVMAVDLRDLSRAYGERVALAGVTLMLPRGATLAVARLARPCARGRISSLGHSLGQTLPY